MKESELAVNDKIQKQNKETDQILKIFNKLWPLFQKFVAKDAKIIDKGTRDVLRLLGEMMGKDTAFIEESVYKYEY